MIFRGAFGGGLSERKKIQSGVWCACRQKMNVLYVVEFDNCGIVSFRLNKFNIQCLIVAVQDELWLASSRSPWSAHWAVIGWAVPRLLAAGCWLPPFLLLGSDTRHTTVSGGHPDPADAAHTINTPVLGLWQVEMLTMSEGINSVFCAMVLCHFRWIETFLLLRQFLSAKWPTKLHVCYVKCFQNFL